MVYIGSGFGLILFLIVNSEPNQEPNLEENWRTSCHNPNLNLFKKLEDAWGRLFGSLPQIWRKILFWSKGWRWLYFHSFTVNSNVR